MQFVVVLNSRGLSVFPHEFRTNTIYARPCFPLDQESSDSWQPVDAAFTWWRCLILL